MFGHKHYSLSELFSDDDELMETFGAAAAAPAPAPAFGGTGGFTDPRLRGLDLGSGGGGDGYDYAARRYAVGRADPYEQIARREIEIGRRMPGQYQAPSALAGMPSITGRDPLDDNIYQDLHSEHAVMPAASVAGQRQTHYGTFGARTDTQGGAWWDAHDRTDRDTGRRFLRPRLDAGNRPHGAPRTRTARA